jgi:hypothetical protein
MKIISFSLWGNQEMYIQGAVENLKIQEQVYPQWKCRFYIDDSVSNESVNRIKEYGCEIINIGRSLDSFHGMFWRFLANDDPNVEMFISRDCDSRINYREAEAVKEWIESGKTIHCMHDHPYHWPVPMLGGMWGARTGKIKDMGNLISEWKKYSHKGIDQEFLHRVIWPNFKEDHIRHDSMNFKRWGEYRDFPPHKPMHFGGRYVGDIFNEKNIPIGPAK